ncbi:MAG: PqqD family peptide modification chaperone [Acidobacteria bacterium]|nr:PqqD family peptide modification chaperone [Acidobacteriota bacterium]
MTETLFSPSWYRVATLKPRLRAHARIDRHEYRGEVWFVLLDAAKGAHYRFTPQAHHVIAMMDGERTIQRIWENAVERFGDDAPTQSEIIQLLSQLHSADLLISEVAPDTEELLRRARKIRRDRWWMNLRTPLAIRIPLVDPERFLKATLPLARPALSALGGLVWLAVVASAVAVAATHWPELTRNVIDRVLSIDNLLILWVAYPLVKILHELGHGYTVKHWGGECHEMGILLLVLVPVPYVDASASSQFRERHRRALVAASGIFVEVFLAAIGLLAWATIEPGILRSVAYNVALIGSVSTILFNANPLLRYDGYYVLSDLVDVPNLAQRGRNYVIYLVQKHGLRIKDVPLPYAAPGERFWFVFYTVASFLYRAVIYSAIIFVIATKFFTIGLVLAAWALAGMILLPIWKGAKFLLTDPALREGRGRAVALTCVLLALVALAFFVMPFPCWTRAEGVVSVPDEALLRARTSGFVTRVAGRPGDRVARGDLLVETSDPFLVANARVLRAQLEEMQSRYDAARTQDNVDAKVLAEELRDTAANLARAEERADELKLLAPTSGSLILPDAEDLPDLYLKQGDLVGYVLDVERPTIRVVVPQSQVDLVRNRTIAVQVRLAQRVDRTLAATVRREIPGAIERLPSTVLGRAGGGEIAIDPSDEGGRKTFEKTFQFELQLTDAPEAIFVGGRAYVRFDHGYVPAAFQIWRMVRQLVLRRLNV